MRCEKWLAQFNERYNTNITRKDIIRPYDEAIGTEGSIAVLKGNLDQRAQSLSIQRVRRKCLRQF